MTAEPECGSSVLARLPFVLAKLHSSPEWEELGYIRKERQDFVILCQNHFIGDSVKLPPFVCLDIVSCYEHKSNSVQSMNVDRI